MVPLKSRPGGGGLCGLACVRASDIDAHSEPYVCLGNRYLVSVGNATHRETSELDSGPPVRLVILSIYYLSLRKVRASRTCGQKRSAE